MAAETAPARAPASDAADAEWAAWARCWASWDPNLATREPVLAAAGDAAALRRLLGGRLEFGTAGLRGPMGPGSLRMNDLVVIQTTQGVCAHLERSLGAAEARRRGVCVGFDHRRQCGCDSRSFALRAAAVLLLRGFRVYLYDDDVATPLVPWCLEEKGCCAGIMITASHNPKADNGYKLYWETGAQIIPPHDALIAAAIEANLEPWAPYDVSSVLSHENCVQVGDDLIATYISRLRSLCHFPEDNEAIAESFQVTYTYFYYYFDYYY